MSSSAQRQTISPKNPTNYPRIDLPKMVTLHDSIITDEFGLCRDSIEIYNHEHFAVHLAGRVQNDVICPPLWFAFAHNADN